MKNTKLTIRQLATLPSSPAPIESSPDDSLMGAQLTEQYKRAKSGEIEILKFGAMMLILRDSLTLTPRVESKLPGYENCGRYAKNSGLSAWLKTHAPTIPEPSAYRYMAVAKAVQKRCHLEAASELERLLTVPADDLKKADRAKQLELFDTIENTSQKELLAEAGPGRGKYVRKPFQDPTPEECLQITTLRATGECNNLMAMELFSADTWKLLSDATIDALQFFMDEEAKKMRKHLQITPSQRQKLALQKI